MSINQKYLIVISGPTAVGKTDLTISLAQHFDCPILSCDSRQIYKELNIGTAKVTEEEQKGVPHHFINNVSIEDSYSAGIYEEEAIELINELHKEHKYLILSGGTGLYIQAVLTGLDHFPDVDKNILDRLENEFEEKGILALSQRLKELDPQYYESVDTQNSRRVIRALSVIEQSGKPFSTFLNSPKKERNFVPIQILLEREREALYTRINQRVDLMIEAGLVEEVKGLINHKELKALDTVGYREIFDHLDGKTDIATAIELIKRNTRRYAKRQMTWFRRDPKWNAFHPDERDKILSFIDSELK
jgi:tRNA dimethylallyltransferase